MSHIFTLFLVLSYFLSDKLNSTLMERKQKILKLLLSSTAKNLIFIRLYHCSCHSLCLEIMPSSLFPLSKFHSSSKTHLEVISTMIFALISSGDRDPSFLVNVTVLNFYSSITSYAVCVKVTGVFKSSVRQ